MILVNIEFLSLDELRSIAVQEGINDIDTLSREELIDLLREKYEEDDSALSDGTAVPNLRYLSGITDYRAIDDYLNGLPGVETLPDEYPETEIHLLLRNSSWAYCYWSIANLKSEEIVNANGEILLNVTIAKADKREVYDIPVSVTDSEWNIGISYGDGYCQVELVSVINGERNVLASSEKVSLVNPYWIFHKDEMKDCDSLYRIYLSLMTAKNGELVLTAPVRDIIAAFRAADVNE